MKTITTTIAVIIFLTATATAIDVMAGDSFTFNIGTTNDVAWGVVGNSSDMTGMTIVHEGTNITLSFDTYYQQDNFTLVFYEPETEQIIVTRNVGGGSGGIRTVYRDNITYVDVDKIVTEFVDREVEVDVPVEVEVEVEVPGENSIPRWVWILVAICLGVIVIYWVKISAPDNTREEEEQEKPSR